MYFSSRMEIDPSQITVIKKVKHSNLFDKFKSVFTGKKLEQETFTVISILEQIQSAFEYLNIKNVIRLSVDHFDIYSDENFVENDLEMALFHAKEKLDPINLELFESIFFVFEHEDNDIKYYFEIRIFRKHYVGEFPIQILIHGLINEFMVSKDESKDNIIARLENFFSNQKIYDETLDKHKQNFDEFVLNLQLALGKCIGVDGVIRHDNIKIVRPETTITKISEIKINKYTYPIFKNYPGVAEHSLYCYYWAELCHKNNIYISNSIIVDENGHRIIHVGKTGFYAKQNNILNPSQKFEVVKGIHLKYYVDNKFGEIISEAKVEFEKGRIEKEIKSMNWLDNASMGLSTLKFS